MRNPFTTINSNLQVINSKVDSLVSVINELYAQGKLMPKSISELKDLVAKETSVVSGAFNLINSLRNEVADLLSKKGLSPVDQADVDAIFTNVESNRVELSGALNANTGVETTPVSTETTPISTPTNKASVTPKA